jgi:hypothetical protein
VCSRLLGASLSLLTSCRAEGCKASTENGKVMQKGLSTEIVDAPLPLFITPSIRPSAVNVPFFEGGSAPVPLPTPPPWADKRLWKKASRGIGGVPAPLMSLGGGGGGNIGARTHMHSKDHNFAPPWEEPAVHLCSVRYGLDDGKGISFFLSIFRKEKKLSSSVIWMATMLSRGSSSVSPPPPPPPPRDHHLVNSSFRHYGSPEDPANYGGFGFGVGRARGSAAAPVGRVSFFFFFFFFF